MWIGYFAILLLFSPFPICLLLPIYIFFLFDLFCFASLSIFTRVGPSVPEIFRGDFLPKWDHLCPRYSGMTFSPEWDHLCPRYLGALFHPSGSICAQNVRFNLKATIIVDRLFCQFVVVLPRFPFVCLCLYTFFLFDLFCFASLSVFT